MTLNSQGKHTYGMVIYRASQARKGLAPQKLIIAYDNPPTVGKRKT